MAKGAAIYGSPAKKGKKEAAAEKVHAERAAETVVVRSANLSRPPEEEEIVHDEPNTVAELGKKITPHFRGKKSWGPKEIRDRLVQFLSDEQVEDQHLVAYLKALEAEAGDDSGVAARNPFRKNLIEVITNMVVSILVCY